MAECINCGEYTKFNGGHCFSCYKKNGESKDVIVAKKEPQKKEKKKKK
jgi:hypothetical protein